MKAATETAAVDIESQVAEVADRFTEEVKQGRSPSVEEYAQRHPEIAHIIRQVFPALAVLDEFSATSSRGDVTAGLSGNGEADEPVTGLLGDFRILHELGRGGMGVVYEAEQISLGRRVALKVLPFAAMLDKQQLARFKNEARAAATLDHPNIVAIFSVGTERGVHYYAMQLVEGQSLAEIIAVMKPGRPPSNENVATTTDLGKESAASDTARAALSTLRIGGSAAFSSLPAFDSREYFRAVARLGIQAAEALDHAHQNGILHRDVKPANLLLDDFGKLWITDFGLARIEADAGLTMTGDLLGTLRYMSPEQALAKRVVVDHRSDIYSLGVTLYELLTLRPAYIGDDRQELLRQIAFDEPRKPRQINARIPQDLETLILKAVEKNPADRYLTAQELADDLRRFLDDQPIRAKPQSLLATTRKWTRRHSGLLAAAAVLLLMLAVGSLISAALLMSERQRTQLAAAESKAVADFLVNDLLRAPNQGIGSRNPDITIRQALEKAELKLATAFKDQPMVESKVRSAFATSYWTLGKYAKAVEHQRRGVQLNIEQFGAHDHRSLAMTNGLATLLVCDKKYDEARRLCETTLEEVRRELGPEHSDTLFVMKELVRVFVNGSEMINDADAEYAQQLCEDTLRIARRVLGPDQVETIGTAYDLAVILRLRGQNEDALRLFQEALKENLRIFGPDHFMTLHLMREEAATLAELGRTQDAETKLLELLEGQKRVFGDKDEWTNQGRLLLANVESMLGKHAEAARLYEEVLEIARRLYDVQHDLTFQALQAYAWFLATEDSGQFRDGPRAVKLATEACELSQYSRAHGVCTLAAAYAETGDFDAAVKWSRKASEVAKNSYFKKGLNEQLKSFQAGKSWRKPHLWDYR